MAVAAPIFPPALDQLDLPDEVRAELLAASIGSAAPTDIPPDVVLPAPAFASLSELMQNPPAPSTRLRELLGRGTPAPLIAKAS